MSAELADWTVSEPGLYRGMPEDVYHADPVLTGSLSHSGAKTLISHTPALFAYQRDHGRPDRRTFDFGHAAHRMVLGAGPQIVAVDADNWMTKAAKAQRDEIRASGGVPILREEHDAVTAMAAQIKAHPVASKLLAPGSGEAEVSAFAEDPETGVTLRCRYDWLRPASATGRLILVDYKSAVSAEPDAFAKSAANYGYHIQDVWYSEIAAAIGLADDVAFLFVVQEKTPPYLVNVIQLDKTARTIGALLRRHAIDTYRECSESGEWPGYSADITLASLPVWYERAYGSDL